MFKKSICVILAAAVAVLVTAFNSRPLFYGLSENCVIYTAESSSCALQSVIDSPVYPFMAKVKGESCKLEKAGFDVNGFFERYGAEILFTEEAGGVTSYYGYGKDIKFLTEINGVAVNLHVAVAENQVTVGSPIIFGSF